MSDLILIVDDERDLVSTLSYNLEREGYRSRTAYSGKDALVQANLDPFPDLILLDLMLPDISGVEVCQQLRANERTRRTPVVMLTAKGDEIDRVVGFEVGADDYVTKPFSVRELMLRIRAVLRRAGKEDEERRSSELTEERLKVDIEGHRTWVDGEEVALTALEFKLLVALMTSKGRVQTRNRLLEVVWGIHADVTTRTVDTHVKRLRQRLGPAGEYIETRRGMGYRFQLPGGD